MISKSMTQLVQGNSVIRALFEEGREMAREVGAENVYDFRLGEPECSGAGGSAYIDETDSG